MFELRDKETARMLVEKTRGLGIEARFMHVCGTHQDTLVRHGLETMLKGAGVEVRQGPGCPVCVTTQGEIEEALALARAGKTIALFGDMLNVPGTDGTLADARGQGGDVRIVYSVTDALELARDGQKEVVFLGIGFETTAPTTAAALLADPPENFSVLSYHRTMPNALKAIMEMGEVRLHGLIEPGHVSTIIGSAPYQFLSKDYKVPQVIAGFEPLDLLMGIYLLAKQVAEGRHEVENEYTRLVKDEGNPKALEAMGKAFVETDVPWRGFPVIPGSGLDVAPRFEQHDARKLFEEDMAPVHEQEYPEPEGCRCGEVLRGIITSRECPLFGDACKPGSPVGPCMVSKEGSCNIEYKYGIQR